MTLTKEQQVIVTITECFKDLESLGVSEHTAHAKAGLIMMKILATAKTLGVDLTLDTLLTVIQSERQNALNELRLQEGNQPSQDGSS